MLIPATNPTGFELGKVTVFINFHRKGPTPGEKLDIATELATVREPDSIIVQVTLELFQLSSANFSGVPALILSCLVNHDAKPAPSNGTNEGTEDGSKRRHRHEPRQASCPHAHDSQQWRRSLYPQPGCGVGSGSGVC